MKHIRWHWIPTALVTAGVFIVWASALAARESLGTAFWGVLAGGFVALVGIAWFFRRVSSAEIDFETAARESKQKQAALDEQQSEFEQQQNALQEALALQATRLEQREQRLINKLAVWHEWTEFPEPVDLAADVPPYSETESLAARDLAAKDRQLFTLLEAESKRLFERIEGNEFVVEGQFQAALLRDDVYTLITKVARVYWPEIENPLLETSVEQLLRGASRVCLHFLVVLEQLPVKVQQYNMASMYGWVKQGVRAFGVYRSAKPYLPYVNSAWYVGRFAMGSNPITLLAWWAASEVASRGASAAAKRVVNRQALALLHDVVRVIGIEVASLYGDEVRHRDANWIYAVELVELVRLFPASRECLSQALKEVGIVQLLNEYDRIFIYRCLAEQKSAQPQRYRAVDWLSAAQRQAITTRLERFYAAFVHGKTEKRVAAWRDGVQRRLGVQLDLSGTQLAISESEQIAEAVRSLASFLVGVKQREAHELPEMLKHSRVLARLPVDDRQQLLLGLAENPPFFLEQPTIDPATDVAEDYLRDLVRLAVRTPPTDLPVQALLLDLAAYLRRDEKQVQQLADAELLATFNERFPAEVKPPKLPVSVAHAALQLLEAEEQPRFVYGAITVEGNGLSSTQPLPVDPVDTPLWLIGTDLRLLLVTVGDTPSIVWVADGDAQLERLSGVLAADCRVRGGTWLHAGENADAPFRIRGAIATRYEKYFAPLVEKVGKSSSAS